MPNNGRNIRPDSTGLKQIDGSCNASLEKTWQEHQTGFHGIETTQ